MDITLILGTFVTAALVSCLWICVRNLYFHPLSRFPGPLAAGATMWWRILHEVVYQSDVTTLLPELHKKYGAIIRTSPGHLHFSDPKVYHELYNGKVRWDKDEFLYHSLGEDGSAFASLTVERAKARKTSLAPPLSRREVYARNNSLKDTVNRFCTALEGNDKQGQPSNILYGVRCFSLDVISKIAFCGSINSIGHQGFRHPILVTLEDALPAFQASKFIPWVYGPLHLFSVKAISKFWPSMASLLGFRNKLFDVVMDLHSDQKTDMADPCILHTLMNPSKHTAEEKLSLDDLVGEAQTMIAGGVQSVADTALYAIVFAAQDKEVSRRLREELVEVWPDPHIVPDLTELEKLPLLTAVIKESLRLGPGIPTPLTRVVPPGGATISGQFIPAGTIVGITARMLHYSEELFEDASLFKPDRWLHPNAGELDHWLVPFSKGPRSCLGLHLAWAELYVELGAIFRRFNIELTPETSKLTTGDLVWRDCFLPCLASHHPFAYFHPIDKYQTPTEDPQGSNTVRRD